MFFQLLQNTTNIYYSLSIIYLNIIIYVCLLFLLFNLLFLFDLGKLKTLNNFKFFSKQIFFSITILLLFLSISGIPPLSGFAGKFLLLNFMFFLQKKVIILIFSFLNFFSIYFYAQNIRFLVSRYFLNFFLIGGYYYFINKKLLNIIVILNFLNFFSILYLSDIFYIMLGIFSTNF
jgi:NADH:ubiquinone oxidoreductase subunit 2 (subunit N)